jgi:DNA invertase Pin-like site-specific DNA recombinase
MLADEGKASKKEIADQFSIDRSTLYRVLAQRERAA